MPSYMKLHAAARAGDIDEIALLIQHGIDVDATNNEGATALFMAAFMGHYDAVDQLLSLDAASKIKHQNGDTAQDWARRQRHMEIVELLEGK